MKLSNCEQLEGLMKTSGELVDTGGDPSQGP